MVIFSSRIALAAVAISSSTGDAFTFCKTRHQQPIQQFLVPLQINKSLRQLTTCNASDKKKSNDQEDDSSSDPSMADALRRLESLESLDDFPDRLPPKTSKSDGIPGSENSPYNPPSVPMEKEVQLYQDMIKELETTDEQELYDAILSEMGASRDDTWPASTIVDLEDELSGENNEAFMNQAFQDAMNELERENPSVTRDIFNDKELMREIEAIFERGNEKLMESLEDIRKEQGELARASASKNAQKEIDMLSNDSRRLDQAEASISSMLQRVNRETAGVSRAVEDLQRAQSELDKDFLFKLKNGGIAKQGALVGFVLFSIRSIVDQIASFGDESHMTAALAQGAIAIICAAYFFLV